MQMKHINFLYLEIHIKIFQDSLFLGQNFWRPPFFRDKIFEDPPNSRQLFEDPPPIFQGGVHLNNERSLTLED